MGKILLRAVLPGDAESLRVLKNDPALQFQLLSHPRPHNDEQVAEWLKRRSTDPTGIFFTVCRSKDNEPVGFAQLSSIDQISGTADFGVCIAPDHQGNNYGSEAIQAVSNYGRDTLHLRKFWLRMLASNERARLVYFSTGFNYVGTLSKHFFHDGKLHDVLVMEKFL